MDDDQHLSKAQMDVVHGEIAGGLIAPDGEVHDARSDQAFEGPFATLGIDRDDLCALTVSECLTLLSKVTTGHLAVTVRALPTVLPVRLEMIGDQVVVTSMLGDAVPLRARSVVALEAGTLGEGQSPEWTVEVCGFLARIDVGRPRTGVDESFSVSTDYVRGWSTAPLALA